MPPEIDPTQQGGQEEVKPTINPRNAAMAQIAQGVHDGVKDELAGFDEDTGVIEQKAETTPADVPDEPSAVTQVAAEPKPEDTKPRMLTIVVDGQSIEVEETRILEAGKRTLQKESAADRRLQEAAEKERRADAMLQRAQRLSTPDAATLEQTPSQDASPQSHQQPAFDPVSIDTYLENKLYMRDANKAAEKFKADFPEIAGDPHLMSIAANLEQQRLNTATALGESFGDPFEAYRKHGEAVKDWLQKRTGTTPPAQTMQAKAEAKRTITAIPAVNARAPAPATPKVLTVSEQIEQMRTARGRGHPVQRVQ
jgi:hypothetical protein